MADGNLTLKLDAYTSAKIEARAKSLGLDAEALLREMIGRMVGDDTVVARPSTVAGDYDGPYTELSEALTRFDAELERRLAFREE